MSLLDDLYIRFMIWLGAAPPAEYDYLLAGEGNNPFPKPLIDSSRSPLSLSPLEFLVALIGGGIAWFWLRYNIWHAQPWYYEELGNIPNEPYPEWFVGTRAHLLTLIWPVTIAVALAAIFLVRSYGNIRYFSSLGHLVLAWPLIDFLFLAVSGSFGIFCLPIQFVLALIIAVKSPKEEQNYGDLIVIPLSIAWTILGYWYALMWWGLIGD